MSQTPPRKVNVDRTKRHHTDAVSQGSSRPQAANQAGRPPHAAHRNAPVPGMRKSRLVKQVIPADRFIKKARPVTLESYESRHRFEDFALSALLKANIKAKGYLMPTPIQDQTISLGLAGKDVVGIANTGTGKTAAFSLPLLEHLTKDTEARALVMAPTRELASQIQDEAEEFARGTGIRTALLIGGASLHLQKLALRASPRLIIGTPGRIKDHLDQGTLRLGSVKYLVLDEVDRMLDMGFIGTVRFLLGKLAPKRQNFFFSATMDKRVEELIRGFSLDPITVSVKQGETTDNVDQDVVWFDEPGQKIDLLQTHLLEAPDGKFIIFEDTKHGVEKLAKELNKRGFKVDRIHGNKSQNQRLKALGNFKDGSLDILVATDVAARGIDVSGITHVINYSQPVTFEDYVHRIGRAGRAGNTGTALTFLQRDLYNRQGQPVTKRIHG